MTAGVFCLVYCRISFFVLVLVLYGVELRIFFLVCSGHRVWNKASMTMAAAASASEGKEEMVVRGEFALNEYRWPSKGFWVSYEQCSEKEEFFCRTCSIWNPWVVSLNVCGTLVLQPVGTMLLIIKDDEGGGGIRIKRCGEGILVFSSFLQWAANEIWKQKCLKKLTTDHHHHNQKKKNEEDRIGNILFLICVYGQMNLWILFLFSRLVSCALNWREVINPH